MPSTAQQSPSSTKIDAQPPHVERQIADQETYVSARSAKTHTRAVTMLSHFVVGAFDIERPAPDGWWIYAGLELRLGQDVLVPSLAGWRRDRLSAQPESTVGVAPDWVCEVLTQESGRPERLKLPAYARHGVRSVWLVHPTLFSVEVFTLQNGKWSYEGMHIDDAMMRAAPFEELEIPLNRIWLQPTPEPEDAAE